MRQSTILILLIVLASSCSNVSQAEYDAVVAERDSLAARLAEIDEAAAIAAGMGEAMEMVEDPLQAAHIVEGYFAEDAIWEDAAVGYKATGSSGIRSVAASTLAESEAMVNTEVFAGPGFAVTEWIWTRDCTFPTCSLDRSAPVVVRGITIQVIEDGTIVRNSDYPAYSPYGYGP